MFQISFIVKVQAEEDEVVKIVGNLPQFGEWNPEKGLLLERD